MLVRNDKWHTCQGDDLISMISNRDAPETEQTNAFKRKKN